MSDITNETKKHWTITLEEDPETGELVMPLPDDALQQAGFKEGDILVWKDLGNGSFELRKKVDNQDTKDVK
jgi:hypothetical protein